MFHSFILAKNVPSFVPNDSFLTMKIDLKRSGHITTLSLNQEIALKDREKLHKELLKTLGAIEKDSDTRVLILEVSASEKYINCERPTPIENSNTVVEMIRRFSRPVIASVNGRVDPYMTKLSLGSHISIASDDSTFMLDRESIGPIPEAAKKWNKEILSIRDLARKSVFKEVTVGAKKLADIGLLNLVVPVESLSKETDKFAEEISDGACN